MERTVVSVAGMSCGGCERSVESALQRLGGVSRVDADHGADTVEVVLADEVDEDDVTAAIERAGYDVVG